MGEKNVALRRNEWERESLHWEGYSGIWTWVPMGTLPVNGTGTITSCSTAKPVFFVSIAIWYYNIALLDLQRWLRTKTQYYSRQSLPYSVVGGTSLKANTCENYLNTLLALGYVNIYQYTHKQVCGVFFLNKHGHRTKGLRMSVSQHKSTKMIPSGSYHLVFKQIHMNWWEITNYCRKSANVRGATYVKNHSLA